MMKVMIWHEQGDKNMKYRDEEEAHKGEKGTNFHQ